MAGTKNHDYHILPPDIAPLATTIGALTFTSGMVLFMHDMAGGKFVRRHANPATKPGTTAQS